MRAQVATIYVSHGKPIPKEYTFKLQAVGPGDKGDGKADERKTIAKVKVGARLLIILPGSLAQHPMSLQIDLAAFCSNDVNPPPQDVFLALQCVQRPAQCGRCQPQLAEYCPRCCAGPQESSRSQCGPGGSRMRMWTSMR